MAENTGSEKDVITAPALETFRLFDMEPCAMRVNLHDGSFSHQKSFTLGGENADLHPQTFQWDRDCVSDSKYTWYTDMCIQDAAGQSGKKVALLIEPPSLSRTHYDKAVKYRDEFDYILSFWREWLVQFGDKGLWYPLGGSWIAFENQFTAEKTKNICIIVSQKKGAHGHRMRHSTVEFYAGRLNIDVFGRGYNPFESKSRVLYPYRYAIIIESWTGGDYFSEKLVDALSMGCVPIYCGCPHIGRYFNKSGILTFDTLGELEHILIDVCSKPDYEMRLDAVGNNFYKARQYQCAEDWIFRTYDFLFT